MVRGALIIADLKPYPEYKVSGHAWLGDGASPLEVMRLRLLFTRSTRTATRGMKEKTVLSLRYGGIVNRSLQKETQRRIVPNQVKSHIRSLILVTLSPDYRCFRVTTRGLRVGMCESRYYYLGLLGSAVRNADELAPNFHRLYRISIMS